MRLLGKFFVWVGVEVLKLCDLIYDLFRVLAGISPVVDKDGNKSDILSFFGANKTVSRIFAYLLLMSILIGAIFMIISLIKNVVTLKKTSAKVVSQYMWSVLGAILCFAALLVIFGIIGQILALVDEAFRLGGNFENQTPGERIMELLVRQAEDNMEGVSETIISDRRKRLPIKFKTDDGKNIPIVTIVNNIMGIYPKSIIGLEKVEMKFDTFPFKIEAFHLIRDLFPYGVLLVAAFTLLFCSFGALFALCIRLFDIVFLQFAMPLCMASWAYDDGARFKMWTQTMFSKLVLAFGTIFAVNTFMVFIPRIMELQIPKASPAVNSLFRIFLVVCGGFTISSGQTLFARLIGTDASEARQMGGYLKHAVAGVGATIGTMKKGSQMLKNGLLGKKEDPIGTALGNISKAITGGALGGGIAGGMLGGGGATQDPKTTFTGRTPYQPMKFKNRQEGTGLIAGLAKAYNTAGRILGGDTFIKGHADNMALLKTFGKGVRDDAASVGDKFMANSGLIGMATRVAGAPFGIKVPKDEKATAFAKGQDYMPNSLKGGK